MRLKPNPRFIMITLNYTSKVKIMKIFKADEEEDWEDEEEDEDWEDEEDE